ncbi:polysulfide reductase NrfD family protein [Anaeromyxobacter oryzisoli]|uniref:Ni/Fe-hydrogenase cytochrome b subunit n=1 Tax=Anaeromyxobacter oryzisoli TaxID=2925408 RepID=UPI001F58FBE1|nr:Ni/Fe-hydrogenase cytochrome b subunit [Anaeromyxobacter sp. SG63]
MGAHGHPKAIGGALLAPPMKTLLALFGVAAAVIAYRVFAGVGPVSNMSDGFTWGIWEPVNVVVFTGIGAGAYAVGLLCYVLNKGQYHGLVRPAVLVGAISYTLGGSSILVALGRYWNAVLLPWLPFWNLGSALLEVAVCVMTYTAVLWVEVLPAILEAAAQGPSSRWSAVGKRWGARLAVAMPFIIALAVLLPTMHQSSLGGLMLIAGPKIHPLWHTALLPTLFLVSCLSMGFGAVVVLVNLLRLSWNAKADQKLFVELSRVNAALLLFYVVLRVGDVALHGKLRFLGANFPTFLFLVELALFVVPAILFLSPKVQANRGRLFGAALLSLAAGAVYRVDTYMTMYRPAGWTDGVANPAGWDYWPSLGELAVTVGMASVGVAVFILVSRLFPVVVVQDARTHSNLGGAVKSAASR